ncbi:hypothetical protein [Paraburkholderia humisilvae]|uniref:Uncharacterized protein n=1 Tax=Paraburkholderia humisilvae TaxID=627669 RepID=A0A6J5F6S1_9BURK|nr:hypothetical protein [Paraburkholderia humisilvae]CAB3774578.1 hypothetical protein LMG29542_07956 [Paraburkholderia humisilvae]
MAEQWNSYRHPERVSTYAQATGGERVVYFDESEQLDVDATRACEFVTCTFDYGWAARAQQHAAIDSARFWLNETILKLPAGMSQRYQEMARRGQYFANLAQRLNLTPAGLDQHLVRNSISDAEHARLVSQQQPDLFSLAA